MTYNPNSLNQLYKKEAFEAICNKDQSRLEKLIEQGFVTIDDQNKWKITLLRHACENKNIKAMEYLISNGADLKEKTEEGFTLLHTACIYGNKKTVEYLVKKGIEINTQNDYRETALHIARYNKCDEIAEILMENGAKENIKNDHGETSSEIYDTYKKKQDYFNKR